MYTAKIVDIKKDVIQATGEPFLDVEVAILNGEEIVETQKHGYPLDTDPDKITDDVSKILVEYEAALASKEASRETDALSAKADETIDALKGAEVSNA